MKKITLNVYADPSHSWVKVKKSILKDLGIANKISCYSYSRKDYAYLEEDQDAGILVQALKEKGVSYKFKVYTADRSSKIRNYFRFDPSS